MPGLLEVAAVERVEQPRAEGFDAMGCAMQSFTAGVCDPINLTQLSGSGDDNSAPKGNLFVVVTSLMTRAMCSPGNEKRVVGDALDMESEKAAGHVLWGDTGENASEVSLAATSVGSVTAGANSVASVGAALQEFWSRATGIDHQAAIVHLGVSVLLEMFGQIEGGLVKNLGIRVATSPGYPADGIAITGPVKFKLGPDEVLQRPNETNNDVLTEGTRLGVLEFDPCIAVKVA